MMADDYRRASEMIDALVSELTAAKAELARLRGLPRLAALDAEITRLRAANAIHEMMAERNILLLDALIAISEKRGGHPVAVAARALLDHCKALDLSALPDLPQNLSQGERSAIEPGDLLLCYACGKPHHPDAPCEV